MNKIPINKDIVDEMLTRDVVGEKVSKCKYTRTRKQSFTGGMVSVTKMVNNYIIGHLTIADLSILKDFEEFKENLDIVNKSLISLKKPMLIDGVNVHVRDTMLLAPGGKRSLSAIGSLYGEDLSKIEVEKSWLSKMDEFWLKEP